jgi:hypothetical protein
MNIEFKENLSLFLNTECSTHFTWTNGTCNLIGGPVSREDALVTSDQSMVCGIVNKGETICLKEFGLN